MKKTYQLLGGFVLLILASYEVIAQDNWRNWESEQISGFYVKQDIPYGALDQNGNLFYNDYLFLPKKLEEGTYEVSISDSNGSMLQIDGTTIYLKFSLFVGFMGYGTEGVLVVNAYGGTFYKQP